MLVLKDSFTKTTVFGIFWPKYPLKWPPWAPCRQSKSLKTTVKFLICVYLVSKVLEKCLSINSCWSWRVQSQKAPFFLDFRPNYPLKWTPKAMQKPKTYCKVFKLCVSYVWGPSNVPRYGFMLVLKGSIIKITVFCNFWQNYPLKRPPWAPCRQGKSLKTTVKFLICVYLAYGVQ